jgi:ubiquinone/menaquinone biosynthesis C-methylase UbiE
MSDSSSKPVWSEDYWHEKLIYQRKMMWREDTFAMLPGWLELRPGIVTVDVGCGRGYMGYTFWEYFGSGGCYVGIDSDPKLLDEARTLARRWATGGAATFLEASAYSLPLPENHADWVTCQTLLIHLERPEEAVAEMVRVAKPGGLVTCFEPDNVNPSLGRLYNSVPETPIEEHLLYAKINLIRLRGRIKMGNGDNSIGPKVPHLLREHDLIDIDVRLNDKPHYLEPPYTGPLQQRALEGARMAWGDRERYQRHLDIERKEFLAGGGDPAEFDHACELSEKRLEEYRRQLEAGEYYACAPSAVYAVKGRKPL